jgi:hypothetical protein
MFSFEVQIALVQWLHYRRGQASGGGAMSGERLKKIKAVAPGAGLSVIVTWDNGRSDTVDLSGPVRALTGLAPLRKAATFRKVRVADWGWALAWPRGRDMSAATLWRLAQEQSGRSMPAAAFEGWRRRHRLTQAQAAHALGLSPRMVKYYASGEKPVPRTVALATLGYEAQARGRRSPQQQRPRKPDHAGVSG